MIDILKLYNEHKISVPKMKRLMWDSELKDEASGEHRYYTREELGLSRHELTAIAYGVPMQRVALWRQLGWENRCWNCFQEIDIENWGWFGLRGFLQHFCCTKKAKARHRMYIRALKMKERYVKHKGHYREL